MFIIYVVVLVLSFSLDKSTICSIEMVSWHILREATKVVLLTIKIGCTLGVFSTYFLIIHSILFFKIFISNSSLIFTFF